MLADMARLARGGIETVLWSSNRELCDEIDVCEIVAPAAILNSV
jgi:hypothetical protein